MSIGKVGTTLFSQLRFHITYSFWHDLDVACIFFEASLLILLKFSFLVCEKNPWDPSKLPRIASIFANKSSPEHIANSIPEAWSVNKNITVFKHLQNQNILLYILDIHILHRHTWYIYIIYILYIYVYRVAQDRASLHARLWGGDAIAKPTNVGNSNSM